MSFKVEMPASVTETQVPFPADDRGLRRFRDHLCGRLGREPSVSSAATLAMARIVSGSGSRWRSGPHPDDALSANPGASDTAIQRATFRRGTPTAGTPNARLVLAGPRLYLLVATFPNAAARRDDDVNRFSSVPSA